jgi:carbamoyl-phosphate synthase large subunit
MKDLTVLSTACSSAFMPGFFRCLKSNKERNIRIIGVDMQYDPSIKLLVDTFYQVPAVTSDDYVDKIIDICRKEKVDVFFPQMSSELLIINENKSRFENIGVMVSLSTSDTLHIANNKLKLYKFMDDNNLPTPDYFHIKNISDLEKTCNVLGYPEKAVCLKLTESSGSRGVRIIDSSKSRYDIFVNDKPNSIYTTLKDMVEVLSEKNDLPEMIVMEYLPGIEYSVDLLAVNGRVQYIVGRKNNVSLMSIAQDSTLAEEPIAYKLCIDLVRLMNLDGNIGFDFLYDEDGIPILMDINPRITATISVSAAGGVNFPYLRIKQLLGEELPEVNINYGVRLKRKYSEVFTNKDGCFIDW